MSHAAQLAAFSGAGPLAEVQTMTPHRQVELLMGGLLSRLARLRHGLKLATPQDRHADADRALAILAYLRTILDHKHDPKLAEQLTSLYRYCESRVLVACAARDDEALQEVTELVTGLKQAWDGIAPKQAVPA